MKCKYPMPRLGTIPFRAMAYLIKHPGLEELLNEVHMVINDAYPDTQFILEADHRDGPLLVTARRDDYDDNFADLICDTNRKLRPYMDKLCARVLMMTDFQEPTTRKVRVSVEACREYRRRGRVRVGR